MPRPTDVKWTECEDAALQRYMQDEGFALQYGPNNWTMLSYMPELRGKTNKHIRCRWYDVLDPALVKGAFEEWEDKEIRAHVVNEGAKAWSMVAPLLLTLATLWCSPGHVSCVRVSIPKRHPSIPRWRQWSLRGGGEKPRTRRGCKRFAWELDAEVACSPTKL